MYRLCSVWTREAGEYSDRLLGTKWHGKVFAEARYVHIFMNNGTRADYVPVTFGFRW
jgi:hypothetical protein